MIVNLRKAADADNIRSRCWRLTESLVIQEPAPALQPQSKDCRCERAPTVEELLDEFYGQIEYHLGWRQPT